MSWNPRRDIWKILFLKMNWNKKKIATEFLMLNKNASLLQNHCWEIESDPEKYNFKAILTFNKNDELRLICDKKYILLRFIDDNLY